MLLFGKVILDGQEGVVGNSSKLIVNNRQVMINYKIAFQKGNQKAQHFNHFSQVKLPIVDKKVAENMKKSLSKLKAGKLPLLNFHQTNLPHTESKRNAVVSQLENRTEPQAESNSNFAQLIQQKIHEIANKNQLFNMDYYTNEGQDFEQNIAKNKEFLKEQREKRGSILVKRKENDTQSPKQDHSRRITQNLKKREDRPKFISKAKKRTESPAIHNSKSESILMNQEHPDKRKVTPSKGGVTNRLEKKMQELKKKLSRRKNGNESKIATEGDVEQAKSQNLFDNIHNYLANPHRLSFDLRNITTSGKLTTKRSALQAKIKAIDQKILSLDRNVKEKPAIITLEVKAGKQIDQYGVGQWRRMQFQRTGEQEKNLLMKESNFEKQVNQINILQQRNQRSLERYLENQRILFDLKLIKSNSTKDHLQKQFRSK